MRLRFLALAAALAACGSESPEGPSGPTQPPEPAPFLGGCEIFPGDNAWNRDVSGDPVHPNSAALIAAMQPAWYVTGASDPRWGDALDQLRENEVSGGDFEVVESGAVTTC